jgi:HEAT repeat protein
MTSRDALDVIRKGDPIEAMEATKVLLQHKRHPYLRHLAAIAKNKANKKWNRIAAIHVLGFMGSREAVPPLLGILVTQEEDTSIRGHAAESIGILRGRRAIPALVKILQSPEPYRLKTECVYALSKMWEFRGDSARINPAAFAALQQCALDKPRKRRLAKDIEEAMSNIRNGVI